MLIFNGCLGGIYIFVFIKVNVLSLRVWGIDGVNCTLAFSIILLCACVCCIGNPLVLYSILVWVVGGMNSSLVFGCNNVNIILLCKWDVCGMRVDSGCTALYVSYGSDWIGCSLMAKCV